jgi:hypothetical protein
MFYRRNLTVILLFVLMFGWVTAVSAQTPRPTPTNVSTTSDDDVHGSIQGHVYLDANGDGVCVNSGVEGEIAVEGVAMQFVSSDEQTIITVTSGEDGGFGLFAAGQSNWRVTAQPETGWVVTSENPLYVPVYSETLGHTGVDFCVAQGTVANGVVVLNSGQTVLIGGEVVTGAILLPEAGEARTDMTDFVLWGTAVLGLILFGFGAYFEYGRRRSAAQK